ncbi:MAG TPA: hypothetical protein VKB43_06400 [Gaiellaceae bacterium]|nr:hypothetical protein [Gaiellaceae bacterium]
MTPERRARRLLRWYPTAWRERYGEEFTRLLEDDIRERPRSWHRTVDVARSGLAAQLEQGPLRRSRLVAAGLMLGAALAAAAVLHALVDPHQEVRCPPGVRPQRACALIPGHGWVNPAVLTISLLGLAAAVGVFLSPRLRRLAGTTAILGAGAAAVVWVATSSKPVDPDFGQPVFPPNAWTTAEAVLIALAAVGVAMVVLVSPRLSRLRLAIAGLVLGAALAGASVPHLVHDPGGYCNTFGIPYGGFRGCLHSLGPAWVEPTALALCALAAAGAALLLLAQAATSARRARSSGP